MSIQVEGIIVYLPGLPPVYRRRSRVYFLFFSRVYTLSFIDAVCLLTPQASTDEATCLATRGSQQVRKYLR